MNLPLFFGKHGWSFMLLNFGICVNANDEFITKCFGLTQWIGVSKMNHIIAIGERKKHKKNKKQKQENIYSMRTISQKHIGMNSECVTSFNLMSLFKVEYFSTKNQFYYYNCIKSCVFVWIKTIFVAFKMKKFTSQVAFVLWPLNGLFLSMQNSKEIGCYQVRAILARKIPIAHSCIANKICTS